MSIEEAVRRLFGVYCITNGVRDFDGLPEGDRAIVLDEFKRWLEEVLHECSSGTA